MNHSAAPSVVSPAKEKEGLIYYGKTEARKVKWNLLRNGNEPGSSIASGQVK
jgi:hypothetical protein